MRPLPDPGFVLCYLAFPRVLVFKEMIKASSDPITTRTFYYCCRLCYHHCYFRRCRLKNSMVGIQVGYRPEHEEAATKSGDLQGKRLSVLLQTLLMTARDLVVGVFVGLGISCRCVGSLVFKLNTFGSNVRGRWIPPKWSRESPQPCFSESSRLKDGPKFRQVAYKAHSCSKFEWFNHVVLDSRS